jgi:PAS domain S-box-containing protein
MRVGEIWRSILGRYDGERHRLLVELCPDALFIHSRGRFVFANAAGLRLLGADLPEQVLGRRVLDFVHPDFHALVRAQFVGTDAASPPGPSHEVLRRVDGRPVDAETSTVAFTLRGERAVGVVARDVTERRRVEGELRRSEERLAAFVRNVPGAAFIKDERGRYVLVNEKLKETGAADSAAWIGRTDDEIYPQRTAERLAACDELVLNTHAPIQTVEAIPQSDGEHLWLVGRFPIPGQAGSPALLGGIGFDVTKRVQEEREHERLAESERAARTAAEAAFARLTAIHAVTDSALAQLGLDELLGALLSRVRSLLRADSATVLLATPDGEGLAVRACDGVPLAPPGVVAFGRGIVGRIASERAPMAIDDAEEADLFGDGVPTSVVSLLGTPLLVDGRAIGVLHVTTTAPRTFTLDETRLLQLVADRTAMAIDRARLFEEARESQRALEALSSRLLEVQEEEKRRLARELHDDVGQRLTALKLIIGRIHPDTASSQAKQMAEETLSRVRDLSQGLAPPMLEDLGLLHALLWHVERFEAQTRIKVTFRHSALDRRFPPEVELSAFRIVQESLTNIARHAGTSSARLHVWANDQRLGVEIEDDGEGFDPKARRAAPSVGLTGMRERVRLAGGRLTLRSAPGEGTAIAAVFPLVPVEEAAEEM